VGFNLNLCLLLFRVAPLVKDLHQGLELLGLMGLQVVDFLAFLLNFLKAPSLLNFLKCLYLLNLLKCLYQ
jgi:hypothetical protein